MKKIAIVTDSSASLDENYVKRFNIHVIPLKLHWNGMDFEDGVDITPIEFYERLEKSSTIPTTSQPPAEEFFKKFEELAPHYDGIAVPLISSGISGTVDSAKAAASSFSKLPIEIIDTQSTQAGLALIIKEIIKAVSEGKNLDEIHRLSEVIREQLELYFVVDTLKYLHKGGRIGGASRYLGTLLNIKPILYIDKEGKIDAFEKAHTKGKALVRLIELVDKKADGRMVNAGIMHANVHEEANRLGKILREKINCSNLDTYPISPVIGTHVGPGALGIAFYPKEIE